MAMPLASKTIYAHEKATDSITKVTLTLGLPEEVHEGKWRVTWRIDLNDEAGTELYVAGRDAWQGLMLAIPLLESEAKRRFRKKNVTFHFTREAAEQQIREVFLDELFPESY
jgi:hypothetical protein